MLRINRVLIVALVMLTVSCIRSYKPEIDNGETGKYVVSGRVTDTEGWQEVEVSMSSPVESAEFIPLSGCNVRILSGNGDSYVLDEYLPGFYRVWMDKQLLAYGTAYRVEVLTPSQELLVSDYDTLIPGPAFDTAYAIVKEIPTTDPENNIQGLQFYVDLDARGYDCRFFKWEILETWEYHSPYPAEHYYNGKKWFTLDPPDYNHMICWITRLAKEVLTVSTRNLSENRYQGFPLHFVDGYSSSRLGIQYSPLVRQFAISEAAYNYWEKLRLNSYNQGGLYDKQPAAIKGNIVNTTFPAKTVLGFFYAASESSRRYFFKNVEGIDLTFWNQCIEVPLPKSGWKEVSLAGDNVYYRYNERGEVRILSNHCVDCRVMGGTTEKPAFWPE